MNRVSMPLYKGARINNPSKIVVHAMSEYLSYNGKDQHVVDFLADIGLSAHALVTPSGVIIKCREDNQGAYHAKGYNTDSLGVEFLVAGKHSYNSFLEAIKEDYITTAQRKAGFELINEWITKYGIDKSNIYTHQELSPDRKEDPGKGFQFEEFIKAL